MRRALFLALVLPSVPGPAWAKSMPQSPIDQTSTLEYEVGGTRVVQRVIPGKRVVSVQVSLLGGVMELTQATEGIEALWLSSALRAARDAQRDAGSRSLFEVTRDRTVTGFVTLTEDFERAWVAWSLPLLDVGVPDTLIQETKRLMLNSARRRYTNPDLRIQSLAWRNTFQDHVYRFDPLGTEESLGSITPEQVRAYASQHLVTSRMLIVVVGDVVEERVRSAVQSSFGRLPRGEYTWQGPPEFERRDPTWTIDNRDLPTSYIHGYAVGPRHDDRDYFAFEVASHLAASSLIGTIRNDYSLSYAVGAFFERGAIPAVGIYASSQRPDSVFPIVLNQLANLQIINARPGAWGRFKDQFILDQLAQQLSTESQGSGLAEAALYFGDLEMADEYVDRLRRVNLGAIRRVMRNYLSHLQWAFLGNPDAMQGQW